MKTTTEQLEQALQSIRYSAAELELYDDEKPLKVGRYVVYPFDQIESRVTGNIVLIKGIIDIFNATREAMGVPLSITSGYRSIQAQRAARRGGNRHAVSRSPHSTGTAFDIGVFRLSATYGETWQERQDALARELEKSAEILGTRPWLRIGTKSYRHSPIQTIVHVDLAPLIHPEEDGSNENPNHQSNMTLETRKRYNQLVLALPPVHFPWGRGNPSPQNWRGGVEW